MSRDKIIDRVQKLLALASNAGSEAEAALAAERAAKLMAEHEIHEAQLSLDGAANVRTPEPIEKCHYVTHTQKRVQWHMNVAGAVDETLGTRAYWSGGSVVLFGRLSAVQAAAYTTQYLIREIERITDRVAPSRSYSRAYRNAFRLGCSARVGARIRAAHRQAEAERREAAQRATVEEAAQHVEARLSGHRSAFEHAPSALTAESYRKAAEYAHAKGRATDADLDAVIAVTAEHIVEEPTDEIEERGDDHDDEQTEEQAEEIEAEAEEKAAEEAAQTVTAQALAVVDHDRKEVQDAYQTYSKKWRKGRSLGNYSSGGGYSAGRAAGDSVNITNRSRGGLNAGQGSLKRGRRAS